MGTLAHSFFYAFVIGAGVFSGAILSLMLAKASAVLASVVRP